MPATKGDERSGIKAWPSFEAMNKFLDEGGDAEKTLGDFQALVIDQNALTDTKSEASSGRE